MNNSGICKFCGNRKELIDAHIIPLFFYKPLMEGGVPRLHSKSGSPKKSTRFPRGAVDNQIVCGECEALFAPYDDYAKRFFLDRFNKTRQDPPEFQGRWILIEDYDYPKLKLFFISLLWRASASRHKLFERVRVGPFEVRLKEMIIDANPGASEEFPVILRKFKEDWSDKGIIQPTKFKDENRINCYHFFLGGYSARIKVGGQPFPEYYRPVLLSPDPPLAVMHQELLDCFEYKAFMGEYAKKVLREPAHE